MMGSIEEGVLKNLSSTEALQAFTTTSDSSTGNFITPYMLLVGGAILVVGLVFSLWTVKSRGLLNKNRTIQPLWEDPTTRPVSEPTSLTTPINRRKSVARSTRRRTTLKDHIKKNPLYLPSDRDIFWKERKKHRGSRESGDVTIVHISPTISFASYKAHLEEGNTRGKGRPLTRRQEIAAFWQYKVRELILESSRENSICTMENFKEGFSKAPTTHAKSAREKRKTQANFASVAMGAMAKLYKDRRRSVRISRADSMRSSGSQTYLYKSSESLDLTNRMSVDLSIPRKSTPATPRASGEYSSGTRNRTDKYSNLTDKIVLTSLTPAMSVRKPSQYTHTSRSSEQEKPPPTIMIEHVDQSRSNKSDSEV